MKRDKILRLYVLNQRHIELTTKIHICDGEIILCLEKPTNFRVLYEQTKLQRQE